MSDLVGLRGWCWMLELISPFMVYFVLFKAMLRCTLNLIPDVCFYPKIMGFWGDTGTGGSLLI